jgi:hypothetical protein
MSDGPEPAHRPRVTAAALLTLVYAAAVYALFLAVLAYAVGLFAGRGVPKTIRRAGAAQRRAPGQ